WLLPGVLSMRPAAAPEISGAARTAQAPLFPRGDGATIVAAARARRGPPETHREKNNDPSDRRLPAAAGQALRLRLLPQDPHPARTAAARQRDPQGGGLQGRRERRGERVRRGAVLRQQ